MRNRKTKTYCSPIQPCVSCEKETRCLYRCFETSAPSQRSGLKTYGSVKIFGSKNISRYVILVMVCGRDLPLTILYGRNVVDSWQAHWDTHRHSLCFLNGGVEVRNVFKFLPEGITVGSGQCVQRSEMSLSYTTGVSRVWNVAVNNICPEVFYPALMRISASSVKPRGVLIDSGRSAST